MVSLVTSATALLVVNRNVEERRTSTSWRLSCGRYGWPRIRRPHWPGCLQLLLVHALALRVIQEFQKLDVVAANLN